MKLLFVHDGPIYYDEGKYYEYAFHGLYERYSYLADQITFLMRTAPLIKGERYDVVPDQINVISIPNFNGPSLYFKNIKDAKKIIENEVKKADIVILRDSTAASVARRYVEQYNVPYIWECVGCSWDSMWNYSMLGKALAPWFYLRQKRNIKKSSYVYYVTDRFLQKRYPSSAKQVGCSNVVIDDVDDNILQKRLQKIDKITAKTEISAGTAAAIDVRYKGQEYVIEALSLLKKKGICIKYYLAGGNKSNSHYLQECARKMNVEENVIFCGALSKAEIMEFYDEVDIYIQPSKQEGLPRAVIEAMSRGCPVIGSNIAGIPELIDPDCLFTKGDSGAIALLIEKLVNRDMSTIAKRNFYKAKEYTKEKLEKKRQGFYDEFLNEYFG